jgi:membrane fusion protein (multidrug efflux system)
MASAPTPLRATDKPVDNQVPVASPDALAKAAETPKKKNAPRVFAALVVLAAVGAGLFWILGHGKESTDDAQVEGRIVSVSSRVQGQVARVLVQDNQEVHEGDILIEIDPKDLDAKLAAAKADADAAQAQYDSAVAQEKLTEINAGATIRQARGGLAQASANASASRSGLQQGQANIEAAQSAAQLAQQDLARARELIADKTIPQSELDMRQSRADQSRAQLEQAKASYSSTQANVVASSGGVEVATGRLTAAQTGPQQVATAKAAQAQAKARVDLMNAQLELSRLNRSYADVRAPVSGVVSRRTVEAGQLVDPSRPLLALVPLHDVWVVANFKEDQIGEMAKGQRAKIHVDTYGKNFEGKLDSIAGASGARFALLPPDNASGNFIKVVQRVPVLIRFTDPPKDFVLRPGMSADVTVYTK